MKMKSWRLQEDEENIQTLPNLNKYYSASSSVLQLQVLDNGIVMVAVRQVNCRLIILGINHDVTP